MNNNRNTLSDLTFGAPVQFPTQASDRLVAAGMADPALFQNRGAREDSPNSVARAAAAVGAAEMTVPVAPVAPVDPADIAFGRISGVLYTGPDSHSNGGDQTDSQRTVKFVPVKTSPDMYQNPFNSQPLITRDLTPSQAAVQLAETHPSRVANPEEPQGMMGKLRKLRRSLALLALRGQMEETTELVPPPTLRVATYAKPLKATVTPQSQLQAQPQLQVRPAARPVRSPAQRVSGRTFSWFGS
jgi:hypothetical protein